MGKQTVQIKSLMNPHTSRNISPAFVTPFSFATGSKWQSQEKPRFQLPLSLHLSAWPALHSEVLHRGPKLLYRALILISAEWLHPRYRCIALLSTTAGCHCPARTARGTSIHVLKAHAT